MPALTDEFLEAAEAIFRARPDALAAFLASMSVLFVEGRSLAGTPSPLFVDLHS